MTSPTPLPADQAEQFWEDRYRNRPGKSSGRPTAALVKYTEDLAPGRALELGCAKGDDAVWLARQGWTVTAVDISRHALAYAAENAEAAGVAERISFQQHDLARTFPDGHFDLVTAMFLQSPVEFPRAAVLRKAAAAVAPGGILLVVSHASGPPWGDARSDTIFPTVEQELSDLDLTPTDWKRVFVGTAERIMTGPEGQKAEITDNVVVLRRSPLVT